MREIGSDNVYVLRVRCGEAHCDYRLLVPALDVGEKLDAKEIGDVLVAMAGLVVPPPSTTDGLRDLQYALFPEPVILAPSKFRPTGVWDEHEI